MTTILEALSVVRTRFRDEVAADLGLLVHYDNWPQQVPAATARWVFLRVTPVAARTVEGGAGRRIIDNGLMTAHIYAPVGRGNRDAWELASAIDSAMARKNAGGVLMRDSRFEDIGVQAPWYRIKVEIPFESERIEAAV